MVKSPTIQFEKTPIQLITWYMPNLACPKLEMIDQQIIQFWHISLKGKNTNAQKQLKHK